jgi:hypothetical protein
MTASPPPSSTPRRPGVARSGFTTQTGYVNRNNQIVVRPTGRPDTGYIEPYHKWQVLPIKPAPYSMHYSPSIRPGASSSMGAIRDTEEVIGLRSEYSSGRLGLEWSIRHITSLTVRSSNSPPTSRHGVLI